MKKLYGDHYKSYQVIDGWNKGNITDEMLKWCEKFSDSTCVIYENNIITYSKIGELIKKTSVGLLNRGIKPKDKVVLQLPNNVNFILCFFGLMKIGAIPIMALPAHRINEIKGMVNTAKATGYICQNRYMGFEYSQIVNELIIDDKVKNIIQINDQELIVDSLDIEEKSIFPYIDNLDIAFLSLSGGTTGMSKLIPRTHGDYLYDTEMSVRKCHFQSNDVYLAMDERRTGDIKTVLNEDIEKLELCLAHNIPEFVGFATGPIVIFIYLMTVNVPLALISLIPLGITLIIMIGCFAFMSGMMPRVTQAMSNLNSVIIEYINGMKLIKAYNMGSRSFQKFSEAIEEENCIWNTVSKKTGPFYAAFIVVLECGMALIIPIGGRFFLNGSITASVFLLFVYIGSLYLAELLPLQQLSMELAQSLNGVKKTKQILDLPVFDSKGDFPKEHDITLNAVSFSYDEKTNVLENCNLHVSEGEKIALVGASGAGKTKNISLSLMLIVFVCFLYLPAGVILMAVSLLFIPNMWLSFRIVKNYGNTRNNVCAEAVSSIVEYVNGIQTLRAYGMSGTKNKTITNVLEEYSKISYKYEATGIPVAFSFNMLTWLSLPVVMIVASKPWIEGNLSGVNYLMVTMMPMLLAKLYMTISVDLFGYKNMMISKRKIQKVVNEPEENNSAKPLQVDKYDIVFDNVDFSYLPGETVLKKVSFKIPDKKLTAIVGDSGSGKSTIINLISKYYEPTNGTIYIGSQPINNIAAEQVLKQISMVDQDVFLFDDTIRENIRHARSNATDKEIEEACKAANCDGFIRSMEKSYDTSVGENGSLLSGGERQRISIARAILKNSPILLLDEATASLDIENELAVKQAILNLLNNKKTVIMIAHTLSIVKNADQILVVADGKIVEAGTHEELLNKKGKYAAMWKAEEKLSE